MKSLSCIATPSQVQELRSLFKLYDKRLFIADELNESVWVYLYEKSSIITGWDYAGDEESLNFDVFYTECERRLQAMG